MRRCGGSNQGGVFDISIDNNYRSRSHSHHTWITDEPTALIKQCGPHYHYKGYQMVCGLTKPTKQQHVSRTRVGGVLEVGCLVVCGCVPLCSAVLRAAF